MSLFTTQPLYIIDYPANKNHHSGVRKTEEIKLIVLHDTDSPAEQEWVETLNWLTKSKNSGVSVHRAVDYTGDIYKLLPDDYIANHIGYSRMGTRMGLNRISLGLELRRRANDPLNYPDVMYRATAYQVVEWWGLHGFIPVLGHGMIDTQGKTDPRYFDWPRFYQYCQSALSSALNH